jgi:HEAT repeat protein
VGASRVKRDGLETAAARENDVAKSLALIQFGWTLFFGGMRVDPQATFLKRFGDLVALLRSDPGNDAAQDLALTAVSAALAHGAVQLDAGVETSDLPDALSLQARLLARQVDTIRITEEADIGELLTLARALAHDTMALPVSPHIIITAIPAVDRGNPEPSSPPPQNQASTDRNRRRRVERRASNDRRHAVQPRWPGIERRRGNDRRLTGERRTYLIKDLRAESVRLYSGLVRASGGGAWEEALYATLGLARLAPRVPQVDRRIFLIQVRGVLRRSAIEAMLDLAERDAAVQPAAVEALCWLGLDAAEAMIDRLHAAPVLGPRRFLLEALARMPESYPMVVPLLRGTQPHEIRYGAILAARLGRPEAAPLVRMHLDHPDEEVRVVIIEALSYLHHAPVGDALRTALRHPSAKTRSAAATAIAVWRGGALGVLLGPALEEERDPGAWNAIVAALGAIGNPSACAILAQAALARRSLFNRRGYTREQRLAAVAALMNANTSTARDTLRRLAREADRDVRVRARQAIEGDAHTAAAS